VFSPSEYFECRWHASRLLLTAYLVTQGLALLALCLLDIPLWISVCGTGLCLLHGGWSVPSSILLKHPSAFTGLRRNADGWQLWSNQSGWQAVQLQRDSLALPKVVVLRFRLVKGSFLTRWWVRTLCIPYDALTPDVHRRLRVRLKFSRRRWAAPG